MGIRHKEKGKGAIRLSSLKSQIPADFPPHPEGAPGTLRGSWHFAGKCARSGSQARLRRAAPLPPRPRPLPLRRQLPPLVPAPGSRSPALPLERALPSSLGRFSRPRAQSWVCGPPPQPPPANPPGSPRGGSVGGASRAGWPGGGTRTRGQSLAAAQSERKEGGAAGLQLLLLPAEPRRSGTRSRRAGAPSKGARGLRRAGCVHRLPKHFRKVPLILHAFLRGWSPAQAPSR